MENRNDNIMGSMSEGKLLAKLAMPMIFSVLVSSLYNIIDSIFVGMIGQNALTAIFLGAPASSIMVELSFGVAIGVNALLSRKLGEKDRDGVSKAAGQGFLLMKGATPAQISLAWMLHKYPNVVPIPGSKNKERIIENLNASEVTLTDTEFAELETELNKCRVYGHRSRSGIRAVKEQGGKLGKGFDMIMKNKRIITVIIGILCAVTAASCSGSNDVNSYTMGTVGETASETAAASQSEASSQTTAVETTGETVSETETAPAKKAVLVAYFSNPQTDATDAETSASRNIESGTLKGNVEYAAELIQAKVGGDMFRIETVEPYPAAYDATIDKALDEQRANARPELKNSIDLSGYDTIYLGYPNWWGDMPMAVYTFLEQYDLSGKTVNVFMCHGGSRASSTLSTIKSLQPGADVSDNVLTLFWTDIPDAPAKINEWIG